ncbi:MAG: MFS transporter [Thermoplasmata archaeon]|nr:MFS transporter [Thermoplasmata archaeon]
MGEIAATEDRNPARLFRVRNFRLLWTGSTASSVGAATTTVALSWIVFSSTQSAFAITIIGLANFGPSLVVGLFAGVLADRFERRRLMLRADAVRAVAVGALAVFLIFRGFDFPVILGVVVVVAAFSALFRPASNAILPSLVGGEELGDANGLLLAGATLGAFVGSAVGGLFIITVGAVAGFSLNALTYALSAAMLFLLVIPRVAGSTRPSGAAPPAAHPSYLADLREGFDFVRSQPALLWTILASLVANFFLAFYLLYLVVYVPLGLHAGASVYGAAVAMSGLGYGIGSLLVGRYRLARRAGYVYIFGWGAVGLLITVLAIAPTIGVLLAVAPAVGILSGVANTSYLTCVQRVVPGPLLGRFFAIDEVGSFAVIPLGQIVGGILVVTAGVDLAFLIAGLGTAASSFVLLTSRPARELSDRVLARAPGAPSPGG